MSAAGRRKSPVEGLCHQGELARDSVRHYLAGSLPAAWLTADDAFNQHRHFRRLPEQLDVGYVVAVPRSQQMVPGDAWQRPSRDDGAKGPRIHDRAAAKPPADLILDPAPPTHHRWMMARRSLSDPTELARSRNASMLRSTKTDQP